MSTQLVPSSTFQEDQYQLAEFLKIAIEVFGREQKLPAKMVDIIRRYVGSDSMAYFRKILPIHFSAQYLLPYSVNFTDFKILKTYFDPKFQNDKYFNSALKVAKMTYERPCRIIMSEKGCEYGSAFPMNSELLAWIMSLSKGEVVIEMAGASGENSILLAFSEAKSGLVNDINDIERTRFESFKMDLPSKIRKKLEFVPGSCFNILTQKPEIEKSVGLILCRNLIHFFDDKDQIQLFSLIKKMLKPGGHAIFTINAKYSLAQYKKTFQESLNNTCYNVSQCIIDDFQNRTTKVIDHNLSPCLESPLSSDLTNYNISYLYERTQDTNFKWRENKNQFLKIDSRIRPQIERVCSENNKEIEKIQYGCVRLATISTRFYDEENLITLFENQGFEVQQTFIAAGNGHIVGVESDQEKPLVGIIVKYSN